MKWLPAIVFIGVADLNEPQQVIDMSDISINPKEPDHTANTNRNGSGVDLGVVLIGDTGGQLQPRASTEDETPAIRVSLLVRVIHILIDTVQPKPISALMH